MEGVKAECVALERRAAEAAHLRAEAERLRAEAARLEPLAAETRELREQVGASSALKVQSVSRDRAHCWPRSIGCA